jgi:hypothetical protein
VTETPRHVVSGGRQLTFFFLKVDKPDERELRGTCSLKEPTHVHKGQSNINDTAHKPG